MGKSKKIQDFLDTPHPTLKKFFDDLDALPEDDSFLGKDILTMGNHASSIRKSTMFALEQTKTPINSEKPNVFTNYEDEVGKYCTSFKKVKEEQKVIAKVRKFENSDIVYDLITKNGDNYYDIYTRTEAEKLTEKYAYKYQNEVIDTYNKGDIIPDETVLYRATSFNENMQYGYGLNAKVVYLINPPTIEDAIKCSRSFANRASTAQIKELEIALNTNDLLLNINGTLEDYKSFPDIGEKCKNVACARRRLDYDTALFDLQDNKLRKINPNIDTIFYASGTIVNLDIYSNTSIEILKNNPYNKQIVKYMENQERYQRELYAVLKKIVENPKNKYSNNIGFKYSRLKALIEQKAKWIDDKNDFDNIILNLKVMKVSPLEVGSKISGRSGDKGVLSIIVEDDEMVTLEDGTVADLELNGFGVYNRTNPSQLFEIELNYCGDQAIKLIKAKNKFSEKIKILLDFFDIVNKRQAQFLRNVLKGMDKPHLKQFFGEIYEYGLFIHQPPFFGNVDIDDMFKLYDAFGFTKSVAYYKGQRLRRKQIIANKYIMILRHDPYGKFSSRSSAFLSLKNFPSKELNLKQGIAAYSKTPVKNGKFCRCKMYYQSWKLLKSA